MRLFQTYANAHFIIIELYIVRYEYILYTIYYYIHANNNTVLHIQGRSRSPALTPTILEINLV